MNQLFPESLREKTRRSPTVFDLFCGCGGLSKGFAMDGYQILGGVDHDAAALKTYALNFSEAKAFDSDLASKSQPLVLEDKKDPGRRSDGRHAMCTVHPLAELGLREVLLKGTACGDDPVSERGVVRGDPLDIEASRNDQQLSAQ